MKDGYIKSLDGVRALAIMAMMSFHAELNHFAWVSIQLFFVLSGFLITGILWSDKMKNETVGFKLKRFWARRSLRIFPLYFGYLFFLGLVFLIAHFPGYFPRYAPYLFTYSFNYTRLIPSWQGNPLFTHLWSLSVEEQFYVFFPLIIFLLPKKFVKYFLVTVILLSPLTRFLLGEYYKSKASLYVAADAVYWNTLTHLDAFFLGGAIPVFALDKKIRKPSLLLLFSFLAVIGAGTLNYFTSDPKYPFYLDLGYDHDSVANYAHVWKYSLLNLLFTSFILYMITARRQNKIQRIFENRLMVRIGRVSYGMYFFHWAILVYAFQRLLPTENVWLKLLLFIPYVLVTYGVAELSYQLYEARFLRLKDKLFPKKGLKRPAVAVTD